MLASASTSANEYSINTLTSDSNKQKQNLQQQLQNINSNYSTQESKMRNQFQPSNYMATNEFTCYAVQNVNHCNSTESSNIKMELVDEHLWSRFANLTNEMILTKAGRRTFPVIRLRLSGLEANALYTITIEFRFSDNFKYRFLNGEWKTSPRNDNFKNSQQSIVYQHPDSPKFGNHWMDSKNLVSFTKLKLTNHENSQKAETVFLRSLIKYDPIIHVYKHDKKNADEKVLVYSKFFVETQFIAVTAYQNQYITQLKVDNNPFAKAFKNKQPTITIENGRVITCEPVEKDQPSPPPQQTIPTVKVIPAVQEKPQQTNVLNQQPTNYNTNFLVQNAFLTPKIEPKQDIIPNWYNYYHQTSPTNYNSQSITYPNNFYNYAQNPVYRQYQNYASDYVYNQVNYNNQYSQQQYNQYYPTGYEYNSSIETSVLAQTERSKQSSPLYDSFNLSSNSSSSSKRSNSSPIESSSVSYGSNRPAKRQAMHSNELSSSPVYNAFPKFEFNEQSDDSLNSSDNFSSLPVQNSSTTSVSFPNTTNGSI